MAGLPPSRPTPYFLPITVFLPFILAAIQGIQPIQKAPIQEYYVNFPQMGAIGYCKAKEEGKTHEQAQDAAMELARGSGKPTEWITDEQGQTYSRPMLKMVQLTIQQCPQFFEIIPIDTQ